MLVADDTVICAESQEEAGRPIGKVDNIIKSTEIKCEVFLQSDAGVKVDDENNLVAKS